MAKRHKMSKGHSRHHFTKHAAKTHKKNVMHGGGFTGPMRGGIRI